jgi:lipopolysaccharide transport system ATP-binding protein
LTLCDEALVLEEGQLVMKTDPKSALSCYHDLMRQRTDKRIAQLSGGAAAVALIVNQGSRQGTQEATITAVRLYDRDGRETHTFQSGEGLIIELDILMTSPVKDVACTVGLFSDAQIKCFESAIPSVQAISSSPAAHQTIRCEMKSLPLLAGCYFLNVALYPTDWSYRYDFHWQMYSLQIESRESQTSSYTAGLVSIDARWEVAKACS